MFHPASEGRRALAPCLILSLAALVSCETTGAGPSEDGELPRQTSAVTTSSSQVIGSSWTLPANGTGYTSLQQSFTVEARPASGTALYVQQAFAFAGEASGDSGRLGLGVGPSGPFAHFRLYNASQAYPGQGASCSTFNSSPPSHECTLPFPWSAGRTYAFLLTLQSSNPGGSFWGGWVRDETAGGGWVHIATIQAPPYAQLVESSVQSFISYPLSTPTECEALPNSRVRFSPPAGSSGATASYGEFVAAADLCPNTRAFFDGWENKSLAELGMPSGYRPYGNADQLTCDAFSGWVHDPRNPYACAKVKLAWQDTAGQWHGEAQPSCLERPDLAASFRYSSLGFSYPYPAPRDGVTRTFEARGLSEAGTAVEVALNPGRIRLACVPAQANDWRPFGGFLSGANVAACRFDAQPGAEFVIGAGPGGGPSVQLRDAAGNALRTFSAYPEGFTGGVDVACADLSGDGVDEIITSPGAGGGPNVRVFNTSGQLLISFLAYDGAYTGGLRVAAGDIDGDGKPEIVTGPGPGVGPNVRVYRNTANGIALAASFWAYDPGFTGGVDVAVGDVTGDRVAEVVTGAGPGGGPHVRVFNGGGGAISGFFPYDGAFTGGVRVAVGEYTGGGPGEIATVPVRGPNHVRIQDRTGAAVYYSGFPYLSSVHTDGWDVALGQNTARVSTGRHDGLHTLVRRVQ